MPKFVTPQGRVDIEGATDALVGVFKSRGRGRANVITAAEIADDFDIPISAARECARGARVALRLENEVLAARRGRKGGWYIADREEEAREYVIQRTYDALSRIENIARDSRAAIAGRVADKPLTARFWKRDVRILENMEVELRKVQRDLEIEAATAALGAGDESEDDE
jgi:hypothetical protein